MLKLRFLESHHHPHHQSFMVIGLLRSWVPDQFPSNMWVKSCKVIHSCIVYLVQVDMAELIPLQVKPHGCSRT